MADLVCCRAVNVPTAVIEALEIHACTHDRHPLLIHISTDQVCGYMLVRLLVSNAKAASWPACRCTLAHGPGGVKTLRLRLSTSTAAARSRLSSSYRCSLLSSQFVAAL